jgi:sugar phosphate isomerase/epimerase
LKLLSKILDLMPAQERQGIRLQGWPRWEVQPVRDVARFLRACAELAPPDAVLYLEGGRPPPEIRAYLAARAAQDTCNVAPGTIWPRPARFHVTATRDHLRGLAELARHCAAPEIAVHVHLYAGGQVLLEWYDAFFDDPLYVSNTVPETSVQRFCTAAHTIYRRLEAT